MKKKALLIIALSMAPLGQTTRPMDYTTAFYLTGGLFGTYGLYKIISSIKNSINESLEAGRIMSEKLRTTDLFFIKDVDERFAKVTKYFTENPKKINEKSVYPYSPKAPPRLPLILAQEIKDEKLIKWFKENGTQE